MWNREIEIQRGRVCVWVITMENDESLRVKRERVHGCVIGKTVSVMLAGKKKRESFCAIVIICVSQGLAHEWPWITECGTHEIEIDRERERKKKNLETEVQTKILP